MVSTVSELFMYVKNSFQSSGRLTVEPRAQDFATPSPTSEARMHMRV